MSDPLATQLAPLQAMALRAGELLLAEYGTVTGLDHKAGTELITDVDRRSEELLLDEIRRNFPADAVHAEEAGTSAGHSGRTWYIDPLDGTTNYVHGHPFFAVSLAVAEAGVPLLGVVYAPYLDQMFAASRGGGARLLRPRTGEARSLPRRGACKLTDSLLATGFPYIRNTLVDRNLAAIGRFLHAGCHGIRRCGSAAIDLAYTAAGILDGFWEFGLRPWDTAAGTVIAREAGCRVTDLADREQPLLDAEIVAAPASLHREMLACLSAGTPAPSDGRS